MHFSQLNSSVDSTYDPGLEPERPLLRVEMQGFIDVAMLRERVESLVRELDKERPAGVLLNLLGVSGYGQGTRTLAREWLLRVQDAGIRRVALVAGSSVLRTGVRVISGGLNIEIRCFSSVEVATRWLRGELIPTN